MRAFFRLNNVCTLMYFVVVVGCTMFLNSPVLRSISIVFGLLNAFSFRIFKTPLHDFLFYLIVFVTVSLSNPLFVTNGRTVLFYVARRPYTLEALIYGVDFALALVGVLLWFRIFSLIFTSEKIGSLLKSSLFSSIVVALTLTLRCVPNFKRRYYEIRSAQKTAGFLCGDTFIMRIKFSLNVFFSLAVSSIESSVVSADSMKARGYLLENRTDINHRSITFSDVFVFLMCALYLVLCLFVVRSGGVISEFYPSFRVQCPMYLAAAYALLCAVPTYFEIKEMLKWRFSMSKI